MDIHSLLSPSADAPSPPQGSGSGDAISTSPPSANSSPRKQRPPPPTRPGGTKRTTSGLSNEIRRSPERSPSQPQSKPVSSYFGINTAASHRFQPPNQSFISHSHNVAAPGFRPLPPTSSPSQAQQSLPSMAASYYQPHQQQQQQQQHAQQQQQQSDPQFNRRPSVPHRPISHPRLESLNDLPRQPTSPGSVRTPSTTEPLQSPALSNTSATGPPPTLRSISAQSLADLTMAEAPSSTPPPRAFTSTSLPKAELQTVNDLLAYLEKNSYDYNSHVALVELLHKGFLNEANPREYSMLSELRQAREAMDSRFAVGEEVWVDWVSDEALIAQTTEERIGVTELFQRAVQDEPASVQLWSAFVYWISTNYQACHASSSHGLEGWTEQDIELCRELFTRQMLLDILEQAIPATQWRIDESHLLWNRWIEEVQKDMSSTLSEADVERLQNLFLDRLQIPQIKWDDTMQLFWPIVSKFHGSNWESVMSQATQAAEPGKRQIALREEYELKLQRAFDSGDKSAIFDVYEDYLRWERKHFSRGVHGSELCCALYERALLMFPTYTDWWLDYVEFVIEGNPSSSILPLLERASKHAPWSGDLWAKRILRSDLERRPHSNIEATKHRATNSSLVDVGGMDELVKVLEEWCSFLRRYAFRKGASEDDLDTAEVGIVQALEDVSQIGKKLFGDDFKGDPQYRLEQIQIKFLSEARRFNEAREIYRSLVPLQKSNYEFWWRYYNWELWLWGYERITEKHRVETTENGPHLATAVLELALAQKILDMPEKIVDMYLYHFTQHESGEKLQGARIAARAFSKQLAARRGREARETAAAISIPQQEMKPDVEQSVASTTNTGDKRKRKDESFTNGDSHKKSRTDGESESVVAARESSMSASALIKRDRENSAVTVKNLPSNATDAMVRKLFRDCGVIVSSELSTDSAGSSMTATVEFETPEDASFAQSRDGREVEGREIHIQSGTESTLWVTNYPDVYDDAAIRQLFEPYGEVINVRFPSLKFNSRRRFCYVQFLTAGMAKAAETAMDGKMLDGKHQLKAKVSDPDAKRSRSGPQSEKRELFVKNIDRDATEAEVKGFFEEYAKVERMTLLRKVNGVSMGNGFIVFKNAEDASAALAANNKPFKSRILHVVLSSPKGGAAPIDKARKTDIIVKHSPEPGSTTAEVQTRRGSDASMTSNSTTTQQREAKRTANERKVAILNLPDTVNDARIQAAMEKFGRIKKIQLRRQDEAAIIEFEDLKVAFYVRSGDVDMSALGPSVRTGDIAEVFQRAKSRHAASGSSAAGGGNDDRNGQAKGNSSITMMKPPAIGSRPGGVGRRGGLGLKRGGFGSAVPRATPRGDGGNDAGGGSKSNADFRNLFEKSKNETDGREEPSAPH